MQNSPAATRTPPATIRANLRREVNFGCPICRSPFLSYHHFDPPWEPRHIHREEGMIALCKLHHDFADGGNYTAKYLAELKSNPPTTPVLGQLPWNPRKSFIMFGGNYFITSSDKTFAFRVDGVEIFALKFSPARHLSLSAAIYNGSGSLVCRIDSNDILPNLDSLGDLICSIQGKEICISSKQNDAALSLRYARSPISELMKKVRSSWPGHFSPAVKADKNLKIQGFIESTLDSDDLCPVIKIKADLHATVVPIRTLGKGLAADFRPLGYDKAILTGLDAGGSGIRITYGDTQREMIFMGCEKIE